MPRRFVTYDVFGEDAIVDLFSQYKRRCSPGYRDSEGSLLHHGYIQTQVQDAEGFEVGRKPVAHVSVDAYTGPETMPIPVD